MHSVLNCRSLCAAARQVVIADDVHALAGPPTEPSTLLTPVRASVNPWRAPLSTEVIPEICHPSRIALLSALSHLSPGIRYE
jgi:hypothetical protein